MATNFLTDTYFLEYEGLALHARFQRGSDEFAPRLAQHEFVKVDGAGQEPMGSGPDVYRFDLVFYGATFRKDYEAAVAHFKANPKGLLVHPLLGKKRVGVRAYSGNTDPSRELDSATLNVTFVGAAINTNPQQQAASVPSAKQTVDASVTQLTTSTARYTSSAVVLYAATAATAATDYAEKAATAALNATPDPSVPSRLASVHDAVQSLLGALPLDPVVVTAADTFAARDAALQLYAACLALDLATGRLQPVLETVTLSGALSLSRLCAARYQPSERATFAELIRVFNRIPNPFLIPAGTVLKAPTPTI